MRRAKFIHDLELKASCYELISTGVKDFAICFDDKDFLIADSIIFHETKETQRTGQTTKRIIKTILRKYKGLQSGYLVLGLEANNNH